jgi:hypothetical protein
MSLLIKARAQRQDVLDTYFKLQGVAEERRDIEYQAVIKMQSIFRMYRARKRFKVQLRGAVEFQRCIRGYIGRIMFMREQEEKAKLLRMAFFNAQAVVVQRVFRGYISRKYVHDFYARKKYISAIAERGDTMREEMNRHLEVSTQQAMEQEQAKMVEKFKNVMEHTSHLRSTKAQPSVYSSPFTAMPATILSVSVEDHLRRSSQLQAKQRVKQKKHFDWEAALISKADRMADAINTEEVVLRRTRQEQQEHQRLQQEYEQQGPMMRMVNASMR